jgi:hypothetical protein
MWLWISNGRMQQGQALAVWPSCSWLYQGVHTCTSSIFLEAARQATGKRHLFPLRSRRCWRARISARLG